MVGAHKKNKQTDVGMIPTDWEIKYLKDLVDPERKIRYGIVQPGKFDYSGRYMVRGQDYSFGWVDEKELFRVSPQIEEPFKNARIEAGDIILTIVGAGTGNVEVVPDWLDGANITQTTARIRIIPEKANSLFCKFLLQSEIGKNQVKNCVKGGAQPGLNICDLELFKIPLPPTLAEQTVIATALSDADALISSFEKLIDKKRKIKQGAMQELLTGKKRLPGFTTKWRMKKMADIGHFYSGGTPATNRSDYYGGEIQWITSSDLNRTKIYKVEGRITSLGYNNSAAQMVAPNTLLIALYGATAGVTAISFISAAINQAVLAIIPEKEDTTFLFYKLSIMKAWMISNLTQGGQANLSGSLIKSIEIPIPDIDEQREISRILSDMDAEIELLNQKLAKYKMIKQGMMQQLLTGKTRLL